MQVTDLPTLNASLNGLAALFLALVGMWAVVSYLASLRLAEFGIRAAIDGMQKPCRSF